MLRNTVSPRATAASTYSLSPPHCSPPRWRPRRARRVSTSRRPRGWSRGGPAASTRPTIAGGHNGTLKDGATFGAGKVGPTFFLPVTYDPFPIPSAFAYVQVPHSSALNPSRSLTLDGSLTLDAWIFPSSSTAVTDGTIIGKWGDTGAYANQRAYALSYFERRGFVPAIRFSLSDGASTSTTWATRTPARTTGRTTPRSRPPPSSAAARPSSARSTARRSGTSPSSSSPTLRETLRAAARGRPSPGWSGPPAVLE